jgi:homoserine dehydrogenase
VGRAVAERLLDPAWRADVEARGVWAPVLTAIGRRDPGLSLGFATPPDLRVTDDPAGLVTDASIDVVVELIGGLETAGPLVERALSAGKHVVTANKRLLASRGHQIELAARRSGARLRFEAAVAGGVPVLTPLVLDLAADRIRSVRGIVNGTTNHILSEMAASGRDYTEALRDAQDRGYAEADPSADVEGRDAADKLAILVRLAFGAWPAESAIPTAPPSIGREPAAGITGVTHREVRQSSELGLALKLVARAERDGGGGVHAAATVMAVRKGSTLGSTDGVTNVVEVVGEPVGRVAFSGLGAGGAATSSAVLADLLALGRGDGSTWGPLPPPGSVDVRDDLDGERAWFFVVGGGEEGPLPASIAEMALAASGGGLVTRPLPLATLGQRLGMLGLSATLYPVLADA